MLLGASVAALVAAAFRVASLAAPAGLERVLATAAIAVAAAVAQALALGLVGLGSSSLALCAAALLSWLAARLLVPAPELGAAAELAAWWSRTDPPLRVGAGAFAGAAGAFAAWLLLYPALGYDSVLYHVPEAVTWVRDGHPGSVHTVWSGLPVGSYPLVHEVTLAWGMGISRSFVPASLWIAVSATLIALGAWTCLRSLGVGRAASGFGAAALAASPSVLAGQAGGAYTDPTALAWLVIAAALGLQAGRRPALVCPALLAAALAAGSKTTALPLSLLVSAIALYAARAGLRRLVLPLGLSVAGALVVGGTWYLRNLVEHGSPLWPFVPTPWGDPKPPLIDLSDYSFLDRPAQTLSRVGDRYLERFLGGILLLAGGMAAPLLARTRIVAAAALATAVSLLLWLNAPFTGVFDVPAFDVGTAEATRYLLPGLGAAVLALGLAGRDSRGVARRLALAILAAAAVVSAVQSFRIGFPAAPSPTTPLAGAIAGALAALVVPRLARLRPHRPPPAFAAAAAYALLALLAGAALALPASGYVKRHAQAKLFDGGLAAWFDSQAAWRGGEQPVAIAPTLIGVLAGDRLRHPLELIADHEPCARVARRARAGWVVLSSVRATGAKASDVRGCRPSPRPLYEDGSFRVYGPAAR